MTTGIEKFRLEQRVRCSYFRHRGSVLKIVEELDLPIEYVEKIAKKIKGKCDRDVKFLVAGNIMQEILMNKEQRTDYLVKILESTTKKTEVYLSTCCKVPVYFVDADDESKKYRCLKCNEACGRFIETQSKVHDLVIRVLKELREEDMTLVDAAVKMGFTDKEVVPIIKQDFLIVGGKEDAAELGGIDLSNLQQLTAYDRQRVRKKLEQQLIEGVVGEDNEEKLKKNTDEKQTKKKN